MIWNFFKKKENINIPEFISLILFEEFMDVGNLLHHLNKNDFNNAIKENLNFNEYKNLDIEKLKQKEIYVYLKLFLSDKKDNSKNHDTFRGGKLIGKIDASKFILLCSACGQEIGKLGLAATQKDFTLNENLKKYIAFKNESNKISNSFRADCLNFLAFFSNISRFLSKLEKSKLERSNISFVFKIADPKNEYLSTIEPNWIKEPTSLESLLDAIKFTQILDLQITWNQYLGNLNLESYVEKFIIENEEDFTNFYLVKKGIDIKKWADGNKRVLISTVKSEDFLNQVQDTISQIKKLLYSIENNLFKSTTAITEYLNYQKLNLGTDASEIDFFAKRYLKMFEVMCNPILQLDKIELTQWEVHTLAFINEEKTLDLK